MTRLHLLAGLAALLAVPLQGCARSNATAPSYLGFPVASALLDDDDAVEPVPSNAPRPELRHVASNKVLGAMAFQRTTGRAVDPERLQGRR